MVQFLGQKNRQALVNSKKGSLLGWYESSQVRDSVSVLEISFITKFSTRDFNLHFGSLFLKAQHALGEHKTGKIFFWFGLSLKNYKVENARQTFPALNGLAVVLFSDWRSPL